MYTLKHMQLETKVFVTSDNIHENHVLTLWLIKLLYSDRSSFWTSSWISETTAVASPKRHQCMKVWNDIKTNYSYTLNIDKKRPRN